MLRSDQSHDPSPDLLAASPNGSVTRCRDCGALHLRFGNVVLTLDPSDLDAVVGAVRSSRRTPRRASTAADARTIELHIGETGVGIAFAAAEIDEFESLLMDVTRRLSASAFVMPAPIQHRMRRFPNAAS
jgi:hypothetical protein